MHQSIAKVTGCELAPDQTVRLLIIDDDQRDRLLTVEALRRKGKFQYVVHQAGDVQTGLDLCAEHDIDCVLLDYMLPGETGTDWIGELKAHVGNPHLPVIMLTGAGDETLAASAFHAGASDYLAKAKASATALERAIGNALQKAELYASIDDERAQRERLHAQLADKNKELQDLYHTVSHELKTPLTAAREFVALLLDEVGGPLNETQRDFLETTQGCCDRLAFLLNNWLDTVRSETGKLELAVAPVALAELLHNAVKTYEVLATKANITLVADIEDVGMVNLDGERFQQTLANLLSNAFKFTPADGVVTISCRSSETEVAVSISDTGRGIHEAHQEQIFSPFYQAERSDTSHAQGMGLGLHVCRTIIELHGGRMTLDSSVGVGSTFTIYLPKQR